MKITRIYTQRFPERIFIGKKFGDEDRVNGNFGSEWGNFFERGDFDTLEGAAKSSLNEGFEDGGAYIGLMRYREGEPFEYWIGMFMPPDTPVPDGFDSHVFPEGEIGVGWLYGSEAGGELYGHESDVAMKLSEEGIPIKNDEHGACWFFERYACPRYTTPDEAGNVTLDIGFFVE